MNDADSGQAPAAPSLAPDPAGDAAPLYIAVADELALLIQRGQLGVGDKAPSVRSLSRQRHLSPTTALAALRLLERRGLIEARPQSGYYVRARPPASTELAMTRPPATPRAVGVNNLFGRLVDASANAELVPLGAATPEVGWFPGKALQRQLATTARRRPELLVEYSHHLGLPALQHEIARRYAEMGCELDQQSVLITNGCMEALNLALRVVAQPGDVIAIESPAFFGFLQIIEGLGMKALEIPTHPRDGLSVDKLQLALEGADAGSIKALLLSPNVSNPLGCTMPDAAKRALLKLCERHRLPLIEDDVYGELHFGRERPLPIKAYDRNERVILCSSFSKSLAPGSRVGWIANGRLIEQLRLRKFLASVATSPLMQQTLADFLKARAYPRHLQALRSACADQVARFSEAVERHFPEGTRLSRPQGGFVLWVELPRGADSLALYERALAQGISFVPGPLFSATGRYRSALRLNCGRAWTPKVQGAVQTLGRLAAEAVGS